MNKPYKLTTHIQGTGPTIVLLHGFLTSSAYWEKLVAKLSVTHKVVAIDLLGFGGSPKPRLSTYDYNAQMRSIMYTLAYHKISEPFIAVGHSMGGLLALRFSKLHPRKVKKLILINMPVLLGSKEARSEIYSINIFFRLALNSIFHRSLWNLFRFLNYAKVLPVAVRYALSSRLTYLFQNSAASRLRSFRNIIVKAKVIEDLRGIRVPTVLVHGDQDRQTYLRNIAQLPVSANISQIVTPGGHHLPHTALSFISRIISAK